ncbi:hypothetical protein BJ875DRAFT_444775 [Amylocarpus encephaloides]|uniref:Uncharacterized protein n=1 Tax=Amylocarpus encephaloides TaxID=45428 RepID=A0A9P7YBJ3_9HELO|nr:hypothetical protein BJ875DRAFT_444775 [Amylocarpus encephaloides]
MSLLSYKQPLVVLALSLPFRVVLDKARYPASHQAAVLPDITTCHPTLPGITSPSLGPRFGGRSASKTETERKQRQKCTQAKEAQSYAKAPLSNGATPSAPSPPPLQGMFLDRGQPEAGQGW